MGLAFAQDYDSSTESSGGPKIGDVKEFWLCKFFTGKTGQNEIAKFHQKSEFLMNFETNFYICIVDWRSQNSALQVGIGQIV